LERRPPRRAHRYHRSPSSLLAESGVFRFCTSVRCLCYCGRALTAVSIPSLSRTCLKSVLPATAVEIPTTSLRFFRVYGVLYVLTCASLVMAVTGLEPPALRRRRSLRVPHRTLCRDALSAARRRSGRNPAPFSGVGALPWGRACAGRV